VTQLCCVGWALRFLRFSYKFTAAIARIELRDSKAPKTRACEVDQTFGAEVIIWRQAGI
jgi:hypothetical protein